LLSISELKVAIISDPLWVPEAIKILQQAIFQGKMGYKQAVAQQQLKMPGYFQF
jgi:hypothetical protein